MRVSQPFERPNVERRIFRNLEISNIKRTKDELFDFLNFEFISSCNIRSNYSNANNI